MITYNEDLNRMMMAINGTWKTRRVEKLQPGGCRKLKTEMTANVQENKFKHTCTQIGNNFDDGFLFHVDAVFHCFQCDSLLLSKSVSGSNRNQNTRT